MRKSRKSDLLFRIGLFIVLAAVLVKFAIYVGTAAAILLAFKLTFFK